MKKIFAIALLGATVLSFAACGGKFTCDECGQEKSGKKHTEELLGVKITMCDDCYELYGALADALGDLAN